MRDGRLEEVARAVQLVHPVEIRPLLVRFDERVVGVEVAVVLLCGLDHRDGLVDALAEVGILAGRQEIGGRLYPLVHVGVVEHASAELAVYLAGGDPKVVDPPGFLESLVHESDRGVAERPQAAVPEVVVDLDCGDIQLSEVSELVLRHRYAHFAVRRHKTWSRTRR